MVNQDWTHIKIRLTTKEKLVNLATNLNISIDKLVNQLVNQQDKQVNQLVNQNVLPVEQKVLPKIELVNQKNDIKRAKKIDWTEFEVKPTFIKTVKMILTQSYKNPKEFINKVN